MKEILTKEQSRHLCRIGCKFPYNIVIQDSDEDFYVRISITDLLEILPKEIKNSGARTITYNQTWGKEMAYYDRASMVPCKADELIDALYQLACWYYGEYLKSEKK